MVSSGLVWASLATASVISLVCSSKRLTASARLSKRSESLGAATCRALRAAAKSSAAWVRASLRLPCS